MSGLPFVKMHGLGNDFVILDGRARGLEIGPAAARAIADRRTGVGCDQLLAIEESVTGEAAASMRIFNPDGSEAEACGNGTRCVAALLMGENGADGPGGSDHVVIETSAGLLDVARAPGGAYTVDMGLARTEWREIPLSEPCDTLHLGIKDGPLADPVAVNIGNPHAVFLVDDAEAVDMEKHGKKLERHALFPQRANIEAAQVVSENEIRMRVWERGVGVTRACGSGACAALVAAARRGLTGRKATVVLDGGPLAIEWADDGHVLMTGPVATSFSGELDPSLLQQAAP